MFFVGLMIFNLSLISRLGGTGSQPPMVYVNSDQRPFVFRMDRDRVEFDGGFRVHADSRVVGEVLTDFAHYDRFLPHRHCRVQKGSGNELWIEEQIDGEGDWLASPKSMAVLQVDQSDSGSLVLKDRLHKNFEQYQVTWTWRPLPKEHQVQVIYRLRAKQDFTAEGYLYRNVFQDRLDSLLNHMAMEIERRQSQRQLD
jgi:hypothetical protein